jgi:hypothetical protein
MRVRFRALKSRLPFIIFLFVLLMAALAVHIDWTWKRKICPRGGRIFSIASDFWNFPYKRNQYGAAVVKAIRSGAALFADENKDTGDQRHNVEEENGWPELQAKA